MIEKDTDRRIDDGKERLGEAGIPLELVSSAREGGGTDLRSSLVAVLRGRNEAVIDEERSLPEGAEPLAQVRVEQALESLVHLGDAAPEVLAAVSEQALSADDRRHLRLSLDALAALSPRIGSVMSCLRTYDGPPSLRMEALDSLAASDRDLASFRAVELTRDDDPNLQSDALIALSALDPDLAAGVAAAILERGEVSDLVRETAFYLSCGQSVIGQPEEQAAERTKEIRDCVSMARSAIHGESAQERLAALSWLGENHPDLALCLMADRLKDPEAEVRFAALSALAEMDPQTARSCAPALGADGDERVASLARALSA